MAFEPPYEEIFEEKIGDNVLAILANADRGMKAALDRNYGPDAFPDFAERTYGNAFRRNFPLFVFDPKSASVDESDNRVDADFRFNFLLEVTDDDPIDITRTLVKYVRCFKQVIRAARRSDYMAGMGNTVLPFTLDISYDYTDVGKNPNKANAWVRGITGELRFTFGER